MTTHLSPADQDAAFRPKRTAALPWDTLLRALESQGQGALVARGGSSGTGPSGISMDSRTVRAGDLYVGVPGARRHGAEFAAQVVEQGAVGVLTDEAGAAWCADLPEGTVVLIVRDVRDAVGPAAGAIYRGVEDAAGPRLMGLTGTNGKTTTSCFLTALLRELGERTGLIGTIEIRAGERTVPSTLTTPEATQLHALMGLMRQEQVDTAVMEVSSHAVSYRRISGLHYRVAGFTNLSQDHLDLHGSMEDYFQAKAGLFQAERTDRAVITLDGGPEASWGRRMAQAATCEVSTLSLGPVAEHDSADGSVDPGADWAVQELMPEALGHRFTLVHQPTGRRFPASTGLPGRFNVANAALAACMVLEGARQDWDRIGQVLDVPVGHGPFATAVPGRMEVVGHSPAAIVDFAHNPDGMVRALDSVREARRAAGNTEGRTIIVFGATGDRDATKRPLMGQIAAEWADVVIVTDDDPHSEDPGVIRADVLEGVRAAAARAGQDGRSVQVHESAPRPTAIELAVSLATPQDTVLLAGRGHETSQDFNGTRVELDDRVALREALHRHGHPFLTGSSSAER
ncbi:Mur ligase family protein [Micrococcus terreus]|uniref:Mur ligase family protein n=1 Tax=Micrococcus terreus TaxID=574650 RepID=UPI0023F806BB|nr:UDP-N-acetylmuramoyl-L-alanyl-D-glutamate--2,6-diaminopimelate ligase [Micrococcus terreus]